MGTSGLSDLKIHISDKTNNIFLGIHFYEQRPASGNYLIPFTKQTNYSRIRLLDPQFLLLPLWYLS